MALDCFQPQGLSLFFACSTTPTTAMQLPLLTQGVRIFADAQVHFAFGTSTGSSGLVATMPTSAAPANGICMVGGTVEAFNIGPGAYLSFISSATANVRVTPGYGV
jgi:hypothetical protein